MQFDRLEARHERHSTTQSYSIKCQTRLNTILYYIDHNLYYIHVRYTTREYNLQGRHTKLLSAPESSSQGGFGMFPSRKWGHISTSTQGNGCMSGICATEAKLNSNKSRHDFKC